MDTFFSLQAEFFLFCIALFSMRHKFPYPEDVFQSGPIAQATHSEIKENGILSITVCPISTYRTDAKLLLYLRSPLAFPDLVAVQP